MMAAEYALSLLLTGRSLNPKQSRSLFDRLFRQKMKKEEAKALLLLLAKKGETTEELLGCLRALRQLEPPKAVSIPRLMDTCGTGGDGAGTLNVSTLAAFVIAGAGGKVAKHGNRAISSRAGSSDLMEAIGVRLDTPARHMVESIRRSGIGYFHAPLYHPVFARVQSLRRELKTRTIFNLLGPLANPLKIEAQLLGVSKEAFVPLYAEVLKQQGIRRALVCHSQDGLDEISPSAPTEVAWIENGKISYGTIRPERYGFRKAPKLAFAGGSLKKNHALALKLLQGKLKGPLRDLILINSAAGLVVSGVVPNLRAGLFRARRSLESGRAYRALLELKRLSKKK